MQFVVGAGNGGRHFACVIGNILNVWNKVRCRTGRVQSGILKFTEDEESRLADARGKLGGGEGGGLPL